MITGELSLCQKSHPHESILQEEKMQRLSFNQNWLLGGKAVTLPHDAQITEKRSKNTSNGGHGYFPGGVYTYEKAFRAPFEWENKDVLVEFEGVYKNAAVSLNGKELCFHPYGYTGFFCKAGRVEDRRRKYHHCSG
jgi:hypothetical protein